MCGRKGHTANERPLRIKYKCLDPIYVLPEMKLDGLITVFPKQNYNVLATNFHIHESEMQKTSDEPLGTMLGRS